MSTCRTCKALDCLGDDDYRVYSLQSELYPAVVPANFSSLVSTVRFVCCEGSLITRFVTPNLTTAQLNTLLSGMIAECLAKDPNCVPTGLFASTAKVCTIACADGTPFTYSLKAGSFIGLTQSSADETASEFACVDALQHQICLTDIDCHACVGSPGTWRIEASGVPVNSQTRWSITSGTLPAGLSLAQSGTFAVISGTPTTAGTSDVTILVQAAGGDSVSKEFRLNVFALVPSPLPDIVLNVPFSQQLQVAGAHETVTWEVASGSLPPGLTLTSGGLLSGTPSSLEIYNFTLGTTFDAPCDDGTYPTIPLATDGTSITQTGFDANWESAELATIYRLDVSTTADFSNLVVDNLNVGNVVTYSVAGLASGVDVYFRVRAVNQYGTSGNSNSIFVEIIGWEELDPPAAVENRRWIVSASDSDGSNLFVADSLSGFAGSGRVNTSSDSGATWTERTPTGVAEDKDWFCGASDSDGSNLIVGIYNGRLYTSSDSGVNWTERQPAGATDLFWQSAASSSDGQFLAVGSTSTGGRLYTSSDGGSSWTERQPAGAVTGSWHVACNSDGTRLIAANNGARLYTSSDYGASWTERQPDGAVNWGWTKVASDSDGSFLVACATSSWVYTSADFGVTWTKRFPDGAPSKSWTTVACDSDGSVILATHLGSTTNTGIFLSEDSGVSWTQQSPSPLPSSGAPTWRASGMNSDGSIILAGCHSTDVPSKLFVLR